jgi:Leucine-rich repeat (LRR) protein
MTTRKNIICPLLLGLAILGMTMSGLSSCDPSEFFNTDEESASKDNYIKITTESLVNVELVEIGGEKGSWIDLNGNGKKDKGEDFNGLNTYEIEGTATIYGKIDDFTCRGSHIIKLEINNQSLSRLDCGDNKLTELNLTKVPKLNVLDCKNNRIENLQLTKQKFIRLDCSNNRLKSLSIFVETKYTGGVAIHCNDNQIEKLSLNGGLPTYIYCHHNRIHGENFNKFLESLGKYSSSGEDFRYCAFVGESAKEENFATEGQVAAAKNKGWQLVYNCVGYAGNCPVYKGRK